MPPPPGSGGSESLSKPPHVSWLQFPGFVVNIVWTIILSCITIYRTVILNKVMHWNNMENCHTWNNTKIMVNVPIIIPCVCAYWCFTLRVNAAFLPHPKVGSGPRLLTSQQLHPMGHLVSLPLPPSSEGAWEICDNPLSRWHLNSALSEWVRPCPFRWSVKTPTGFSNLDDWFWGSISFCRNHIQRKNQKSIMQKKKNIGRYTRQSSGPEV